jgi:D-hexose-6-phosphate mutarotase
MKTPSPWEIPGHVSLSKGKGGMDKLSIETPWSTAEIYLHGAHITHFQKKGEEPLLFMSEASEFSPKKPIRGGIPVVFPWFGPRDGLPVHGFARTTEWEIQETTLDTNQSVGIHLKLPILEFFDVDLFVTIGKTLTLELRVKNYAEKDFEYEICLHTYFQISDIDDIRVTGLKSVGYYDKVKNAGSLESAPSVHVVGEVDRVYFDTTSTVEIQDPGFKRVIRVEKSGSNSTVVWNPWIEKSKRMADFGDEEYRTMVCVESGNVAKNKISLPHEQTAVLKVEYSSELLG